MSIYICIYMDTYIYQNMYFIHELIERETYDTNLTSPQTPSYRNILHMLSSSINILLCNTLQHTTAHCNTLQHITTHAATRCNTLQHAATRCNTLQHAATQDSTRCNALQYTAPLCITLQHSTTHCNMLQHAATRYNTPPAHTWTVLPLESHR